LGFRPLEGMEAKEIRERIKLARMPLERLEEKRAGIKEKIEELDKVIEEYKKTGKVRAIYRRLIYGVSEKDRLEVLRKFSAEREKLEKEIEPIEKEIQRRERFRTPPPAPAAPTAPTAPTAPPEEEEEKWRDRHIGRIPSEKEEK